MPFKDPTRVLILPPGATPPTVGQPIIFITPGPDQFGVNQPEMRFYTGDADEELPASIRAFSNVSGRFGIELLSADRDDSTRRVTLDLFTGTDALPDRALAQLIAPDIFFDITDPLISGQLTLTSDGGLNINADDLLTKIADDEIVGPAIEAKFGRGFQTFTPPMFFTNDFNTTDILAISPTVYTTPSTSVGFTFKGPTSGRGLVIWSTRFDFNFSAGAPINRIVRCCPKLTTGTTPGSGSDPGLLEFQLSPNDDIGCGHSITHPTGTGSIGAPAARGTSWIDGLTENNDYSLILQNKCNSATSFTFDTLYQMIAWLPIY